MEQLPPFLRTVGLSLGGRIADLLLPMTDKCELDNFVDEGSEMVAPTNTTQSNNAPPKPKEEKKSNPVILEDINNDSIKCLSKRFRVGSCDTIGRRPTMEDQIVIFGCFGGESTEDYFAVFDGHGGTAASKYSGQQLHEILRSILQEKALNQEEIVSQMPLIFKESFIRCNQGLKSLGVCQETGTTAVVAFSKGNLLWIANVGDSRAVISKNGVAVRVTTDHKPTLESERNRILDLKGYVIFGRVNGVLAVSRALGDFYFHPHVSCEPEVFGPFDVYNDEYQFLILACDGLWDVVDDSTAVDIVKGSKTPEEGAKRLVKSALNAQSTDNISVVVIFFPNFRLNE
jgi:serine/threonine protein phosphatase PrpC